MNRNQLDDHQNYVDPYSLLSDAFNVYVTYIFVNASMSISFNDISGVLQYRSNDPTLHFVAEKCHAIDPRDNHRPKRDGKWIKAKWKYLNSIIGKHYSNFTRSGNQDREHMEDEWVKFLDNSQSPVRMYVQALKIFDYVHSYSTALRPFQKIKNWNLVVVPTTP